MIPIYLDPAVARIALVGRGQLAVRRLNWLREVGASPQVWSDAPSEELAALAAITRRMPTEAELAAHHAVWIADLAAEEAEPLVNAARRAGALANVEDQLSLCDFHTPAVVRRGKLTLAAGTGGASPAAARAARERLEAAFPPSWEGALDEIALSRAALRNDHASFETLIADARARLARHGLI